MGILYIPHDGFAADFIPFYWNGAFHLYYLKDYRDVPGHGEGTPWWHLVTRDFVHFEDWGEALPRGPRGSQDLWVFTGSVLEHRGVFHIYYTGHNHHLKEQGLPVQAVLHATSRDLRTWTKDPATAFLAPHALGYEPDDWRDPFVFWNAEAGEFWMLLAARKSAGPTRNRGCTALAASTDLQTWAVREPFWAPDAFYTHECPDLFRLGDWWYLVFSEFSDRSTTRYRMSRSLSGPWLAPPNDSFDSRAYYAAKTAGCGDERYVFGWLPTREGETDSGAWQWGGHLVVHQLAQRSDGTLAVRPPAPVLAPFVQPLTLTPQPVLGTWNLGDALCADATGRLSALSLVSLPDECLVRASITFEPGTAACGLLLRADDALDSYYQLRLEPAAQRMVIDRWPRPGDQPFMLERPLALAPQQPVHLTVLVDGTCLVVYADDEVALCCRMYEHRTGALGLFVSEGAARFDNLIVSTRPM
jgi:beta-fructofuranosidase